MESSSTQGEVITRVPWDKAEVNQGVPTDRFDTNFFAKSLGEILNPNDFADHMVGMVAMPLTACLGTMREKSQGYGSAWMEQGWMGNFARVQSKVARLRNMLWRDDPVTEVADEDVIETIEDLINMLLFMEYNIETRNRWGRSDEAARAAHRKAVLKARAIAGED